MWAVWAVWAVWEETTFKVNLPSLPSLPCLPSLCLNRQPSYPSSIVPPRIVQKYPNKILRSRVTSILQSDSYFEMIS